MEMCIESLSPRETPFYKLSENVVFTLSPTWGIVTQWYVTRGYLSVWESHIFLLTTVRVDPSTNYTVCVLVQVIRTIFIFMLWPTILVYRLLKLTGWKEH